MELASVTKEMEDEREDEDEFTDELEQQEDAFDNEMVGEINEEIENEFYATEDNDHGMRFRLKKHDIRLGRFSITKVCTTQIL